MSAALLTLLADHCSADELAHLAAARRRAEHPPARLPREAVEELADMIEQADWFKGQVWALPALGWWRRWFLPPTSISRVGPISVEDVLSAEEAA